MIRLLPSPPLRCSRMEIGAGASMAIRKSLFERVGFFDERLGAVPRAAAKIPNSGTGCWPMAALPLRPSRRGAPLSPARNRGTQTPDVPVPAGPCGGTDDPVRPAPPLGQPAPTGRRYPDPPDQACDQGRAATDQAPQAPARLGSARHSRESCITSATFTQPPYPGTDLENPPQAKVAGIDVVETPGDIALDGATGNCGSWREGEKPRWDGSGSRASRGTGDARTSRSRQNLSGLGRRDGGSPGDIPGSTPPISVIVCTP